MSWLILDVFFFGTPQQSFGGINLQMVVVSFICFGIFRTEKLGVHVTQFELPAYIFQMGWLKNHQEFADLP